MWLKKQHPLPCKDVGSVSYNDKAWQELANARGYTHVVIRNIWKELRKDLDNNKWLDGCMSAMSLTTYKLPNGKALDFFVAILKKFISVKEGLVTIGIVTKSKLIEYECWHAKSIVDILQSLTILSNILDLAEGSPKIFMVFIYSNDGEEKSIFKSKV